VKKGGLDRRSFLRGACGTLIALPFLEAMGGCSRGDRLGHGIASGARALNGQPKRFLVIFSGNGTENTLTQWRPSGGETDFTLSPILEPLAPYKNQLLIPDGISMESSYSGPGDAHQRGMGSLLTGTQLLEGSFRGNDGQTAGYAGGISVDQAIAGHIGKDTKFRSLELSVQNTGVTVYARMSYLGPGQPLPPENDPFVAYRRIFDGVGGTPDPQADWILRRRRSVLDTVMQDYAQLQDRVGAPDRQKLEAHLEAIREIERRLGAGAVEGGACEVPETPAVFDHRSPERFPEVARLQMDLMVMALACDLTRVGSIMFSRANNNMLFPWLGIQQGHHDLSHHGDSDVEANTKLMKINRWYAEQMAYLIGRLRAIPDGDGRTLLDNTVVFWVNEQGKGNNHSRKSMPFVLAGGGGGAFRPGRYVKFQGSPPHNNLLVSLLNAFGVETMTFGSPAHCTGPLGGLA
jgi:hypothetical protein